jgi:uncharacterized protein
MSNLDTIKQVYEAFGRGDVPAILDALDEKVELDTENEPSDVPWMQPRRGRGNIAGFFQALAPLEFTRFEPHTFLHDDGNKVLALVHVEANHLGKSYRFRNEGHLWTFGADGKIVGFQHVTDTVMHERMARGD